MHVTTFLQKQLESDRGKYISDSFFRLKWCCVTKGTGRWLGHTRGHVEDDDGSWGTRKGAGSPLGVLRDHRGCWGTSRYSWGGGRRWSVRIPSNPNSLILQRRKKMSYRRCGRKDNTFHCLPAHPQLQQGSGAGRTLQGMMSSVSPVHWDSPTGKVLYETSSGLNGASADWLFQGTERCYPAQGCCPEPLSWREITFSSIVQGSPKEKQETRTAAAKPQPQKSAPSCTACGKHYSIIIPTGLNGAALIFWVNHIQKYLHRPT